MKGKRWGKGRKFKGERQRKPKKGRDRPHFRFRLKGKDRQKQGHEETGAEREKDHRRGKRAKVTIQGEGPRTANERRGEKKIPAC